MCLKEHKNNERENASINSLASKNLYLLPLPELQADDRIREKATQEKGKMGNHTPCGFTANTLFHCRMTNCIEHTLPPTPIPLSPTHTAPAICHSQLQLLPWTFYFFFFKKCTFVPLDSPKSRLNEIVSVISPKHPTAASLPFVANSYWTEVIFLKIRSFYFFPSGKLRLHSLGSRLLWAKVKGFWGHSF